MIAALLGVGGAETSSISLKGTKREPWSSLRAPAGFEKRSGLAFCLSELVPRRAIN